MDVWPCWTYFDHVLNHPDWADLVVLDFGGNHGNFLRDPSCKAMANNYWCLDVDSGAIEMGMRDFPLAHWHHYNRWNQRYNPSGRRDEPMPQFEQQFDLILAYSVFTHTSKFEMIRTVRDELVPRLASGGKCVITLLTPEKLPHFLMRYSNLESDRLVRAVARASLLKSGFYLIGQEEIRAVDEAIPDSRERFALTSFYLANEMPLFWPDLQVGVRSDVGKYQWAMILGRKVERDEM